MQDNFGKTNDNKTSDNWSKGPLTAVGLFLGVFGIAVLSGIFFTHTSRVKLSISCVVVFYCLLALLQFIMALKEMRLTEIIWEFFNVHRFVT